MRFCNLLAVPTAAVIPVSEQGIPLPGPLSSMPERRCHDAKDPELELNIHTNHN
jgi:hypothetical protein